MSRATSITLPRPDDWHLHLRDGAMLAGVLPWSSAHFARAIVMPNLAEPVTTTAQARAYRQRILAVQPPRHGFTPLMTAYLTDTTDPLDLIDGFRQGVFTAAKLYPAHATTHSAHGVTSMRRLANVFDAMQAAGMPLLIHGEATGDEIDVFDREARFVDTALPPLMRDFPALKIVLEHITTAEAADTVLAATTPLAATVTPQHLLLDRNALFAGGLRPHHYCLPVLKRRRHREALIRAVTGGSPRFFLGTDSAPHARNRKESACGCAGIFNAPTALCVYATVFDAADALDRLEAFCSRNGPAFYGMPVNTGTLTLVRRAWRVPDIIDIPDAGSVVPFLAGETLTWAVENR